MKSQRFEETPAETAANGMPVVEVVEMRKPEPSSHAVMIEGTPEEAADKLCAILAERGLL